MRLSFFDTSKMNRSLNDRLSDAIIAISQGKLEFIDEVKFLIKSGADINHPVQPFKTIFIKYLNNSPKFKDLVKFLIENGADVNIKIDYNQSPLKITIN